MTNFYVNLYIVFKNSDLTNSYTYYTVRARQAKSVFLKKIENVTLNQFFCLKTRECQFLSVQMLKKNLI